jgi:hypothetical protein
MFKASVGMFDKYIDKWTANKIKAAKEGNKGLRYISKLFLNSLYGKFGTDIRLVNKVPYYKDGQVKYYYSEPISQLNNTFYIERPEASDTNLYLY